MEEILENVGKEISKYEKVTNIVYLNVGATKILDKLLTAEKDYQEKSDDSKYENRISKIFNTFQRSNVFKDSSYDMLKEEYAKICPEILSSGEVLHDDYNSSTFTDVNDKNENINSKLGQTIAEFQKFEESAFQQPSIIEQEFLSYFRANSSMVEEIGKHYYEKHIEIFISISLILLA